jgi:hypothetical protein
LEVPDIPADTKICDPLTIVKNYYNAVNRDILEEKQCTPGCTKWEYNSIIDTRFSRSKVGDKYRFQLVVGYDDLQYEHVREISVSGGVAESNC